MKYDQLQILSDVVAKEVTVLKVDAPGSEGRGWKRTHAEIGTSELPSGWRQKVADGAKYILKETWVRAGYKSLICVTVRFCSLRLHLRFRQVKANDPLLAGVCASVLFNVCLLSHTGLVCLPGLGTTTPKSGPWCTRMAAGLSNLKLGQEVLTTMRGTGRAPFRAGFARPRFGRSGRALSFVCKERGYV